MFCEKELVLMSWDILITVVEISLRNCHQSCSRYWMVHIHRPHPMLRILNIISIILFQPGTYVTIYLENVPKQFLETHSSQVILYGMFPHEQKVGFSSMGRWFAANIMLYCIGFIFRCRSCTLLSSAL